MSREQDMCRVRDFPVFWFSDAYWAFYPFSLLTMARPDYAFICSPKLSSSKFIAGRASTLYENSHFFKNFNCRVSTKDLGFTRVSIKSATTK